MSTLKALVMSVACAAVAAGSIRGEDLVWTDWDGTGEMPTGGNVRLTWRSGGYDVVIDTEEEMTAVEGWDNLMFKADGSTYLTFANTTRPVYEQRSPSLCTAFPIDKLIVYFSPHRANHTKYRARESIATSKIKHFQN